MLLYNMVKLRYLPKEKYDKIVKKVHFVEKEGFLPPDRRCIVEKGEKFVSLVENNFENGNITFDQALEYLGIKSRHYEKYFHFLRGRNK